MKYVFEMEDLECANCAAKMERDISVLSGVQRVSVNFLTQKMTLEAEDSQLEDILKQAQKICKKYEPDCCIITK